MFPRQCAAHDALNVKFMLRIIGRPVKMFKYTQWIKTNLKYATTRLNNPPNLWDIKHVASVEETKVHCSDTRCGEDVFHQMFIDPGVAL